MIILFYINILNSSILTSKEENNLIESLYQCNKFKLPNLRNFCPDLIYRITSQSISGLRNKCQNRQRLLCLIKTKNGEVFGGYTSYGWRKVNFGGSHLYDSKAFLFSVSHKIIGEIVMYDVVNPMKALGITEGNYFMFGDASNCYKDIDGNTTNLSIKYASMLGGDCYWNNHNVGEVSTIELFQFNRLASF